MYVKILLASLAIFIFLMLVISSYFQKCRLEARARPVPHNLREDVLRGAPLVRNRGARLRGNAAPQDQAAYENQSLINLHQEGEVPCGTRIEAEKETQFEAES